MVNMGGTTTTNKPSSKDITIIEDQLNYEAMMTKKCDQYAEYCKDPQLKSLCQQAAQSHRKQFNELFNWLNNQG